MATNRIEVADLDGPRGPCVYQINTADGAALYVGYSIGVMSRLREHKMRPWWPEADHILITMYPTSKEGRAAELALIGSVLPKYNIRHPGNRNDEWDRGQGILSAERALTAAKRR